MKSLDIYMCRPITVSEFRRYFGFDAPESPWFPRVVSEEFRKMRDERIENSVARCIVSWGSSRWRSLSEET